MFQHQPVMLREVVEFLAPAPGRVFVDGTLGGGGHSEALLRAGAGVFGVDRDQDALDAAGVRLAEYGNFHALYGNFHDLRALLQAQGVGPVDGILLDLGVSSYQLDTAEPGVFLPRGRAVGHAHGPAAVL